MATSLPPAAQRSIRTFYEVVNVGFKFALATTFNIEYHVRQGTKKYLFNYNKI
jgi:hypothetical protein